MIPSRRKLGAAALIIAGIGAFLVPFLLHSPTTQGTSPSTTTPGSGGKNPTTPSGSGSPTVTPSSSSGSTGTCSEDKAKDPSPADNGEGKHKANAYGVLAKQLDTTVALVKAMGAHNAAFHSQHDTKTDNDTIHAHQNASSESSNDNDSSCAEKEETNDD